MVRSSSLSTILRRCVWVPLVATTLGAQAASMPDRISYNRHIRPILAATCFQCHGPDAAARKAGRRLDTFEGATADHEGVRAVVPGQPAASALLARVRHADDRHAMPPRNSKKPRLTPHQIALLERWIQQGGGFEKHWSLIPPTRPAIPRGASFLDRSNPIDYFTVAKLQPLGLRHSSGAARHTLIRRVSFDLTGLPPTPAQVAGFVADRSPDAYNKVVDRLLASRHYGERMAVAWMDVARYGDTSAHHADGPRDMWAWRDLVIRSFNENVGYDQFTINQLAGDLLPNASVQQKIQSAFNRNHCTSDEGGAFDEELRVGYVVDRVRTTSMVWLGLTMECAQCHSHKYDPITQREYYSFYAFFNQTTDPGMQTRGGNQKPTVDLLAEGNAAKLPGLRDRLAEAAVAIETREKSAVPAFERWLATQAGEMVVAPSDMEAHFPLDKSYVNAVVSNSKATAHGKPKFIGGKVESGVRFNGKNYVDVGDVGDFERTDRFSYGCWVFPLPRGHGAAIARMEDRNAHRGWDLYVGGGQGVAMHLVHHWPNDALKVVTIKKLKAKKWQHVFVTYDGSSKAAGVEIYVDGKPWKTRREKDRLRGTTRTKTSLFLGRRNQGSSFRGTVDDVRIYRRTLSAAEIAILAENDPIGDLLRTPEAKRTEKVIAPVRNLFLTNHDPEWVRLEKDHAGLQAEITKLSIPITTVMVMQEMTKPRQTFVLNRGGYDQPTKEQVFPNVPAALPPLGERPANRLGLAQWLVDPDHPLTARVTVNRFWYQVFGRGIVETVEDFGAQGVFPSNPDLLDWLAVDFIENGWNVKRLMRQLVTSRAYRQSARVTSDLRKRDPENILLARGPRLRLDAEFIRDLALSVSGLLVDRVGGPGVKPYQPPGLWNEVSLNKGVRFRQDHGKKLYRRSLYTYWKRSAPPPAMRIFDAPTRERCILRRPRTNTPLQALVTLNDPQFLEAARFLAQRMILEGGESLAERVGLAYRLVLARGPQPEELDVFRTTLTPILVDYRNDKAKAEAFLAVGEAKRDPEIDAAEHAAWTVLASMILNLDEALTK